MSARYNSPTRASTRGARKPSSGKARVMVAAARTAGAKAVPVVVSTPEGASRARTGESWASAQRMSSPAVPLGAPLQAVADEPVDYQIGVRIPDGGFG